MGNHSIPFGCSVKRCRQLAYIDVEEMIKAKKVLKPLGWTEYDLGVDGPDEYLLCPKHNSLFEKKCEDMLKHFIEEATI